MPQSESLPQPAPLPIPQLKSKPVPKTLKELDTPKDYIGSYKTPLLDKSYGRIKNIQLASKRINGYVVEPGRSFSFNGIIGERTIQKGYMSAKVIMDGKFVDDTGGGICIYSKGPAKNSGKSLKYVDKYLFNGYKHNLYKLLTLQM